jgi:23S rRNA (pseudouridine1915-N3)-methyltransferase
VIRVFTIGKKHEAWVQAGIERYQKRLRAPFDVEWVLLPHSSLEGVRARQEESERLLGRVGPNDHVLLLDETGKMTDSPAFSRSLDDAQTAGKAVVFIIGGAYGVDEHVRQRANGVISLSAMVFPHQLVRLILVEQLYRAQEIARGGKYHHE